MVDNPERAPKPLALKPIAGDAIEAALKKAEHYRLLNEPSEAESICLDVLELEPHNQRALIDLVLALTDQFDERLIEMFERAQRRVALITDPYALAYYTGILYERRAKAHLKRGGPHSGSAAYDWLLRAMEQYEAAEQQRPTGNDDSILRWNTCARLLERRPEVQPVEEERFMPLLE